MKYIAKLLVAFAFVAGCSLPASALEDTPANREMEADHYLQVIPHLSVLRDMTEKVAATLPEDRQAMFRALMNKNLDMNAVTGAMRSAMVKNFTADELKALSDFYGSEVGKSAMSKMNSYMADAMAPLMDELKKAIALTEEQMKAK